MSDMTPDQMRAMFAQQNGSSSPKLHSSIFQKFKPSGKLSDHGKSHLHKFADATKKGIQYTKQKHQEYQGQKEADYIELNLKIKKIQESNDSTNHKIADYQRLLNNNHKKMDQPMMQLVRNELQELNGSNVESNTINHADRLQQESAKNNPDANPYWNPSEPTPKKIGHDYQTGEDIFDDDSRAYPEQQEKHSGSEIADILNNERLKHQGVI